MKKYLNQQKLKMNRFALTWQKTNLAKKAVNSKRMNYSMAPKALTASRLIENRKKQMKFLIIEKSVTAVEKTALKTSLMRRNTSVKADRSIDAGSPAISDDLEILALRASKAAKKITDLIWDSNIRMYEDTNISKEIFNSLRKISKIEQQFANLTAQANRTSENQTECLEQIKIFFNEIDEVAKQTDSALEHAVKCYASLNNFISTNEAIHFSRDNYIPA